MEPSFPQFSRLPVELRCTIWRLVIPSRTVCVRLNLDLNAWNGATAGDYLHAYYRIVLSDPNSPLPRPTVSLVNRESRNEVTSIYSNAFQIGRDVIKRALGNVSVSDEVLDTLCNSCKISQFKSECDVLQWAASQLWGTNTGLDPCPLFLAASLSVKHVSIEYECSMATQLVVLAMAVLDPNQTLETMTVSLQAPFARNIKYHFRLAPCPPRGIFGTTSLYTTMIRHSFLRSSTCYLQAPRVPLKGSFSIYGVLNPVDVVWQMGVFGMGCQFPAHGIFPDLGSVQIPVCILLFSPLPWLCFVYSAKNDS
ncbi:hypothetical protein GGR54DRAFT_594638 [Hypoxylon sp. NC1633]|nr:hypothetical protein GGR54DRAFT_594638 [Hypoxylon sp. NC1633]